MSNSNEHPIATEIIYEDDEVRVWNQVLESGATLARHRHDNDYYLVTVDGGGPVDATFHDGTGGSLGENFEFTAARGEATFIPKGHVETAHNRGARYRAILVELKRD